MKSVIVKKIKKKSTLKFVILIVSILIVSLVFLGCNFMTSNSSKGQVDIIKGNKYYTSIVIEEGDTLWTIANHYYTDNHIEQEIDLNQYVNEIKKVNQLAEDKIHIGEYLTVPYYK